MLTKYVFIQDDPFYLPNCHPDWNVACYLSKTPNYRTGECCGDLCGLPSYRQMDLDERPPGSLPYLHRGQNYNDAPQILEQVDALRNLPAETGLGEIRLHTVYLCCFDAAGDPFGDHCEGASLVFLTNPK